jgi:TatD DNase family protein
MKYIDIHCHLDFPDYGAEIGEVLGRMKEKEVGAITIGTDLESSKRAVRIAEENENIWACIGIHPNEVPPLNIRGGERSEGVIDGFEELIKNPKVVAVGECGLDYFRLSHSAKATRDEQEYLFKQQIEFALKYDKPLMLHCRAAYDECLEILGEFKSDKLRGNCHFFAGNVERFLELRFTMSFTGVITFTRDYDEVIKFLPIESIMSETDAPFVAPVPYRGKRNEPSFVIEVVQKMAEIRGESEEQLKEAIMHNARRLFGLR